MKLLNLGCGQNFHHAWVNVDFNSHSPLVTSYNLNEGIPFPDNSFDVVYNSHLLEHFSKEYAPVFLHECFRVLKQNGIIRVVVPDLEQIARSYLDAMDKALRGDIQARDRYEWILLEMFDQMVRNKSGGAMLEYWRQNPMPAEEFVIERVGSEVINILAILRNPDIEKSISTNNTQSNITVSNDPLALGLFRLSGEVHQWMYDRYSLNRILKNAGFTDIRQCSADESAIPDFNEYNLDTLADGSIQKPDSLFMEAIKT
jgi:predicted SAM-dependent methyltransferase